MAKNRNISLLESGKTRCVAQIDLSPICGNNHQGLIDIRLFLTIFFVFAFLRPQSCISWSLAS